MSSAPNKWGCLNGVNVMGQVASIYDGDTLHVLAPVGEAGGTYDVKCRLAGINAPELKTPEGQAAKDALVGIVAETAGKVFCNFGANEKYGRPLVTLYGAPTKPSINQQLIELGHAHSYDGHGPR